MSTAKKRPNQPLLSGPSAICHPLVLLFFLVSSTLSVYFLFTSSLRSSSNLNKNTAPLFIIPQPQVIPNHGNGNGSSRTESRLLRLPGNPAKSPAMAEEEPGPYHNWEQFAADFQEMMRSFKIYVYPHALNSSSASPFADIFLPHPKPTNPKLGNYFSEHMFKVSLLRSSLITPNPEEAHFFFMPFSINNLRNDPRVRSGESISRFVADYTERISREFEFWNASLGADHFYVHCHSVGRMAASQHRTLLNNAIQVTCSSSYFQRLYVAHKDVGLPQVWARPSVDVLTPPSKRDKLVFFSGRIQNSQVRQELITLWGNDTSMDIFSGRPPYPYEEGFKRSRYCLHVKGYEVNTARVSDAINYGCVPVIISNYYDLPFPNILDWSKFSVIINHGEIKSLKKILQSIPRKTYLSMYGNLSPVRRHFIWHQKPTGYDSLHMTAYQLWLRRGTHRLLQ
ncbi:probable glycosyltransferase At3g07620 [Punica granatum]|nr:probable glycosyltransferase At3g07620 [Punica granatum]